MSFPDMVRDQGLRAALAGTPPSSCPWRRPDSGARRLWLEGYLVGLDHPDCPPVWRTYRALVDALHQAVCNARIVRDSDNVVAIGTAGREQ